MGDGDKSSGARRPSAERSFLQGGGGERLGLFQVTEGSRPVRLSHFSSSGPLWLCSPRINSPDPRGQPLHFWRGPLFRPPRTPTSICQPPVTKRKGRWGVAGCPFYLQLAEVSSCSNLQFWKHRPLAFIFSLGLARTTSSFLHAVLLDS